MRKYIVKISFLFVIIAIPLSALAYYKANLNFRQIFFATAPLSYCELGNHPERFDGKLVRVKASIAGEIIKITAPGAQDSERLYSLYNVDCDFGIEANMTALNFDASFAPGPTTKYWLDQLLQGETFAEKKGHQAILTGWFNGRYSNGCWGPKYAMRVIDIEPIS